MHAHARNGEPYAHAHAQARMPAQPRSLARSLARPNAPAEPACAGARAGGVDGVQQLHIGAVRYVRYMPKNLSVILHAPLPTASKRLAMAMISRYGHRLRL